ncbi:MAG TPA: response regulator [Prosthecobacter sp.]|nr:response regulator [Prosthecobacter sp.]
MHSVPPSHPTPQRTGRILVVDDEPHVLAVAKAILDSHGFDVTVTDSGSHALALLRDSVENHRPFSVMVLDLTMPGGLSGFEVMEAIQQADPHIPVIACSGYFQEDARGLCQAIGFSEVLQKPYTLDHLVNTVRRCLTRHQGGERVAHVNES